MFRTQARLPLCTALFLSLTTSLVAQTVPEAGTPPDGGSTEVLQSIFIPPLLDAPFTMLLKTEWVRPLGTDSNSVIVVNQRRIARDRKGRLYQERVLLRPSNFTGPWVTSYIQMSEPDEPDAALWQVPPGFTVAEDGAPKP